MTTATDGILAQLIVLSVFVVIAYVARIVSKWTRLNRNFARVQPPNSLSQMIVGFKKFQVDDYIMTFALVLYLVCCVAIWLQVQWGNSYTPAEIVATYTPRQVELAIAGSKWAVVLELCKVTCVWACKACLIILYYHMTKGLEAYRRATHIVAAYVALGYVVVVVCFMFVYCRPFTGYWVVPDGVSQCATYRTHMIVDAVLNITGDAAMLCLPIPLVVKAKLPRFKKMVLLGVFSLGGLVILCAVLNRITNFTSPYGSLVYLNWYSGELATAVIVANVPHMWPVISRIFRVGSFNGTSQQNTRGDEPRYASRTPRQHKSQFATTLSEERINSDDIDMIDAKYSGNSQDYILEERGKTTTKIEADWKTDFSDDSAEPVKEVKVKSAHPEHGYIFQTVEVQQSIQKA